MPADESISDDVIADLLKKDARESSIKFSALGLQAFLPKRPTVNAPKANTRFLRNIIKETDSHNAALRQKEIEESRCRLLRLKGEEGGRRRNAEHRGVHRDDGSSRSLEHRRDRDDGHDGEQRHRKRRRVDDEEHEHRDGRHRRRDDHRSSKRRSSKERDDVRDRRARERSRSSDDSERAARTRRHRHRPRNRSAEPHHREKRSKHSTRDSRSRSRSRSPSRERARHHSHHHRSRRKRDDGRSRSPRRGRENSASEGKDPLNGLQQHRSDSDPLDAFIGPPPPTKIKSRGRGTFASSSAMDAHFSSTYDPSVDVHPNSDSENDWDQALEALRDRQRWQQQGADRLRSAGFTEDEVQKWEKGGEKREEDVRWSKRGEDREWDRGKAVDGEGEVGVDLAWGRLKGT